MWISASRKFAFVHIPKIAGSSVVSSLRPFGLRHKGKVQHANVRKLKNYLGNDFKKYFIFCFVRNPFEVAVSLYEYMKRTPYHYRYKRVKKMSFEDFLNYAPKELKKNCWNFITNSNGEILVNFIGRYEKLSKDFSKICKKIGINTKLVYINKTKKTYKDYRKYYNSNCIELVKKYRQIDIEKFNYTFDGNKK